MTDRMSVRERHELAQLVRRRANGAKEMAALRAAELLADFESQMACEYAFDSDETWSAAMRAAMDAYHEAVAMIERRCEDLGIPKAFAPSLAPPAWWSRGENAVAARRVELRKVAQTRIAALVKAAKVQIEQASLETQTTLVAGGLDSDAARAFLDAMPTPEALMPRLSMAEVQTALGTTQVHR